MSGLIKGFPLQLQNSLSKVALRLFNSFPCLLLAHACLLSYCSNIVLANIWLGVKASLAFLSNNLISVLAHHVDLGDTRFRNNNLPVLKPDNNFLSINLFLLDSKLFHSHAHLPRIHARNHVQEPP